MKFAEFALAEARAAKVISELELTSFYLGQTS